MAIWYREICEQMSKPMNFLKNVILALLIGAAYWGPNGGRVIAQEAPVGAAVANTNTAVADAVAPSGAPVTAGGTDDGATGKSELAKIDGPGAEMSIQEIYEIGGWPMWLLSVMSVVGLSFVVYFFLVLTRRNITPADFVNDVQVMLSYNRITEARKACAKSRSPAAAIAMAGIDYIEKVDDPDPQMLKDILEGEGGRQASLLQNQVMYLLDIGVIAPMVGLLGTVFGMIQTFNVVAFDIARAKPMELAGGVSQAMITTAGGLLVGIPAMLMYAYFRGRTAKLISNMEVVATDFMTALANRKK